MCGLDHIFGGNHRTVVIEHDRLTFGVYLNRKPEGRRLLVSLSNMIGRADGQLPSVAPLDWCDSDNFHVLSICDPTLYLDDQIEVGIFLGDAARDPIPGIVHIAQTVALELGVDQSDIMFWGVSGGGFGAMMAAIRCNGSAVAINAQSNLNHLRHWAVVREMFRVMGAGCVGEQCRAYPTRTSVLEAAAHYRTEPRIIVVQNTEDDSHFGRHYPELMTLPDTIGLEYTSPEGHGQPTPDTSRWILAEALKHLSQDRAQAA